MVRDYPDEKMGRDVQVRDVFGSTSSGTRMVPCWLVWRLYKPVRNKTDPLCGKQDRKSFWSEKSRYQGPKYPGRSDYPQGTPRYHRTPPGYPRLPQDTPGLLYICIFIIVLLETCFFFFFFFYSHRILIS